MKGTTESIAWEDRGSPGASVLLLVRPLGGSMALWGAFADALAQELRVVTFDALGSGVSGGRPRTSTRALANDARAVLDARSIERAHVFGISLGGMVATRLAVESPSRVSSLILASTAARGVAFERAGVVRAVRFMRCLVHSPRDLERCIVHRVLSREFRAEQPGEVERIAELAANAPCPRATILAHALAAARHDARDALRSIRVPTLVLAGDRDHLLDPGAGLSLSRHIRGSRCAVVVGAGHDLTLERPGETAALVLDFVRATASALQPVAQ